MRNAYAQIAVAPYAVRARDGAPVATPLTWTELETGAFKRRRWTIRNICERLDSTGDPWAEVARARHSIRRAQQLLGRERR